MAEKIAGKPADFFMAPGTAPPPFKGYPPLKIPARGVCPLTRRLIAFGYLRSLPAPIEISSLHSPCTPILSKLLSRFFFLRNAKRKSEHKKFWKRMGGAGGKERTFFKRFFLSPARRIAEQDNAESRTSTEFWGLPRARSLRGWVQRADRTLNRGGGKNRR